MATANFIPEVWSKKLLKIFDKHTVMGNLVNRDFEGDIQQAGDTVHVRTFGNITINNYTRNATINFQALTDPMQDMLIDQQKYFAFRVDDLDKAQMDTNIMEGYTSRAAMAIRDVIDSHLFSHTADVDTGNIIGSDVSPITLTPSNIYSYIVDLGQKLDDANNPAEGRFLVITPKFKAMLLKSPEFIRATSLGDEVVANGKIGTIAGFEVYVTTNATASGGVIPILGFTRDFISFASQVAKVETVRPYDQFCDAVKGLYLYGSKVFLPTAGAVIKASA